MKLIGLTVGDLLDEFNHAIEFPPDWEFICLHGPNGVGKTQLLKITHALLTGSGEALRALPFRRVTARFDDGSSLSAMRHPSSEADEIEWVIADEHGAVESWLDVAVDELVLRRFITRELGYEPLHGSSALEFVDPSTGEPSTRHELLARHAAELPVALQATPQAVATYLLGVDADFIEVNRLRLTQESPRRRLPMNRFARERSPHVSTLDRYSRELMEAIRSARAEYSTQSQKMDRSYPRRLLGDSLDRIENAGEVEALAQEFEALTAQLIEVGLVVDAPASVAGVEDTDAEWKQLALALHLSDSIVKLRSFDAIRERLQLFLQLLNEKLRRKRLEIVEGEGLVAYSDSDRLIPLSALSSGEQHEIVLLYRLIMDATEGKLVLIDEPEVSLHIGWQRRFLEDLVEISKLTKQRFIVATHSPSIIGGHTTRAVGLSDESADS